MLRTFAIILIGAALGAGLGHLGRCAGGTCPLTATWWIGALYGAFLATLFVVPGPRA